MTAGPLDGVRIVDLTAGWAGPLAGRILADLGADVIRIEPPWARGPRDVSPTVAAATHFYPDDDPGEQPWNRSGIMNKHNRNRRGVALRLDRPQGKAVADRILASCDILLENFTPGVMQRLGLTDEHLREINPRLVHIAMPGWGLTGPHHHYAALGPMVEAAAGQCMLMGYRDAIPYRQGMAFPDAISGIHAPGATLVALCRPPPSPRRHPPSPREHSSKRRSSSTAPPCSTSRSPAMSPSDVATATPTTPRKASTPAPATTPGSP